MDRFDDFGVVDALEIDRGDAEVAVSEPSFERTAIVTNARWAGPAIKAFSALWPGKARAFPLAEIDAAKRWAADETDG